jgi:hypothetical protein
MLIIIYIVYVDRDIKIMILWLCVKYVKNGFISHALDLLVHPKKVFHFILYFKLKIWINIYVKIVILKIQSLIRRGETQNINICSSKIKKK